MLSVVDEARVLADGGLAKTRDGLLIPLPCGPIDSCPGGELPGQCSPRCARKRSMRIVSGVKEAVRGSLNHDQAKVFMVSKDVVHYFLPETQVAVPRFFHGSPSRS